MTIAKPPEIFDREAEWAELVDFISDESPHPTLGVVSGRRRQGKTLLLGSICDSAGGIYIEGTEALPAEHFHLIGEQLATRLGSPAPLHFTSWRAVIEAILDLETPSPLPVVIDEFPYLVKVSPELPSVLQAALDLRRRRKGSPIRLILCGSALTFMGGLLAGNAPLRGRAGLELVVPTLDYRLAAEFWQISNPRLALLTHSVVGGTPAYRREYVRDDTPQSLDDFDDWIKRAVLNPARPLFREARYLLAEEPDLRDAALYHSVLAAVAEGNASRGGIANYIGRKATEISHPLAVLEDAGLLAKSPDMLRAARPLYRITEPLISFYHAVMRPAWRELERRRADQVWQRSRDRFLSGVVGPHFEEICRTWAADFAGAEAFGGIPAEIGHGVVNDPERRTSHEVDVVVLGEPDGGPRKVLSLGEVKWGDTMCEGHVERLRRVRDLLADRGYDTRSTRLACYSAAGFTPDLLAAEGDDLMLVNPERLYS
ncbi:ATP-binding protein [Nonomuraea jiangxiensis]|uniref:ATP-binding protein n=1 Tax=Nonomuraea jiangxiensis TaxID=633440 RepID=UPI001C409427|nr:ATP-binding protein [Nonomuraea jiangxiensis]